MDAVKCWVVALRPEAVPVIAKFGLKALRAPGNLFPIYCSKDGLNRLVISGIGRVNAAAATAYLASGLPEGAFSAWINFGIAGSGLPRFGQVFLAAKVTEETTGKSWYPFSLVPRKLEPPRAEVITVDEPAERSDVSASLFEMEAAGFYRTALRVSTMEFCHVVKVVSDDPEHSLQNINQSMVSGLCEDAIDTLSPWLESFSEGHLEEAGNDLVPQGIAEWLERAHFTETQRLQLECLLRQWQSLHPEKSPRASLTPEPLTKANQILSSIRDEMRELAWDGFRGVSQTEGKG